jgi:ATP-dependent DNA helicase HFM1/MER3
MNNAPITSRGQIKALDSRAGVADQSTSTPAYTNRSASKAIPVIRGIQLISCNELPDRFRSVFPFPLLNAVQSKCFSTVYKSSENIVVSAPTGSGKTVLLELAICQLIANNQHVQCKIIYMAPTKSLCAERRADWQKKFNHLGLQCAELTGDTEQSQLRHIQSASIIITTPEKWDSVTRKWKDHMKLTQLVELFLIDEVHILKESRGATLEAVVSRMKSVGSGVRFVALSATVPNSEDVALWLGRSPTLQHLPAHREVFGEEFRPVQLKRYVYGLPFKGNDFAFDSICDSK